MLYRVLCNYTFMIFLLNNLLQGLRNGGHGQADGCHQHQQRGLAPRQAAEKGAYLAEQLCGLKLARVREVRGLGLLIGLELKERVQPFLAALMERGVLALPAGPNVLRLLPPLVIEYEQIDRVVAALAEVLA